MNTRQTIAWFQQLLHLLLFAAAVYCATFLRGNAIVAYGVLLAAPLAMLLSLIPFKYFPHAARQIIQCLVGALALYWGQQQFGKTSIDLALVEIAAILAVALFIGKSRHEYALLFFICIGFLGYGGLVPVRPCFLPVFLAALFIALIILYRSRLAVMIADADGNTAAAPCTPSPQPPSFRATAASFLRRIPHALTVFLLVLLMLHHLPQTQELKTKGLIPVSFHAEQVVVFPELWQRWNKSATSILGGDAPNSGTDEKQNQNNTGSTFENDPTAQKIADAPQFPSVDSRGGNGQWHSIGQNLVFRARTPAKLYWVVQMYDTYDGDQWTCSPSMQAGFTGPDTFIPVHEVEVPQHILMEAIQSKLLPYQYRARMATIMMQDADFHATPNYTVHLDKLNVRLRCKNSPKLPMRYRVQSFVPNPEMKKPLRAWREPARNFGWNYRRLPENVVSTRLRNLAADITKNAENPYEKAIAIRNYLRKNCTYSLDVPKVPDDKEVVDYFLFESKAGYCQHFAQAFTVLARLAGLHSRLVLGFSPGNYNLLTNTFEVFEYHAHAWTHIFAEPYGWLTFDGVPPGQLNIQNTPALLNNLVDPYDSAWSSRPPELTYIPPPPPEKSMTTAAQQTKSEPAFSDQVFEKAAEENRTLEPNAAELGKAAAQLLWQKASRKSATLWSKVTATLVMLWQGAKNTAILAVFALKNISWLESIAAIFAAAALCTLHAKRRTLSRILVFFFRLYACRRDLVSIRRHPLNPRRQIVRCHHIAMRLLNLAALPRKPQSDIAEWAVDLRQLSPEVANALDPIAEAILRCQFSPDTPSPETAGNITSATVRLTSALSPFLSDALAGRPHSKTDGTETIV